jgi:Methyltransferase domain
MATLAGKLESWRSDCTPLARKSTLCATTGRIFSGADRTIIVVARICAQETFAPQATARRRRTNGISCRHCAAIIPGSAGSFEANEYYVHYEPFLAPFRGKQPIVFEIGVFQGHSTKVFANYFRDGKLIGIDNQDNTIDFTDYQNVIMRHGDQSDGQFLTQVADQYAPEGIDIIIDDASHIGYLSLKTFEYLFPRVRSGGVYIVEDWGTGYWNERLIP